MNEHVRQLASALTRAGVTGAFGVPGSGLSWQLITALGGEGVSFTGARHEAAGAIMAGAYARRTMGLGCSITIKGPGLANALPGIVSNRYEQWPVISIAEAFGPSTPSHRMHKRLDHAALLQPVVKAYAWHGSGAAPVSDLAAIARAEVPGPVHLDLIFDRTEFASTPPRPVSVDGSAGDSGALMDRIHRSSRPVVIVGSLATRREWASRLATLRVPVFTTTAAKGAVDEHVPCAAGVFTGDGKALAPESVVIPDADLVIGLGLRNLEVLQAKPFAAPMLLVDAAAAEHGVGFGAALSAHGAPDALFGAILDALAEKAWGLDIVERSVGSVRERLMGHDWLPGRAFAALESFMAGAGCLTVDTGSFCTVAEHVWRTRNASGFLASANGRYMGTGIPMALGSAIAARGTMHVCAVGDGGMMYASELKLAVEQKLPLLVVLMRDGRYGSIVAGASAPGLDMRAVTMREPSWWRTAEAMGLSATAVRSVHELERSLASWSPDGGPAFIEAIFDPEPYAGMVADVR